MQRMLARTKEYKGESEKKWNLFRSVGVAKFGNQRRCSDSNVTIQRVWKGVLHSSA